MRNIISIIKERKETKRFNIAKPYLDDSLRNQRESMLKFFQSSRELDKLNIVKRLDSIKYEKPWPKGTTLDQAFDLALHEAIQIVEHELRK